MRKLNFLPILCLASLFASTVRAQTNTGVNNAELSGNYAFTFRGSSSNGSVSSVYAAVGRFTADGAGSFANRELATNTVRGGGAAPILTGDHWLGSGPRGVMNPNR